MVSTANRHASEAALEMLNRGGSAVDAAIAAQLVLTLVEPQSSGIGGGAFLMHWDADDETVGAYDGREKAPAAAGPDLFLNPDKTPMGFMDAVVGGRAVGVPGVIAMLWRAHQEHGQLDWAELFTPAIRLAQNGFKVSERLHAMITAQNALTQTCFDAGIFLYRVGRAGRRARAPAGRLHPRQPGLCQHASAHRQGGPCRVLRGQGGQGDRQCGAQP